VKHTIDLLLFSAQNVTFGVHIEQVQRMLTADPDLAAEQSHTETLQSKEQELHIIDFSQRLQLHESPVNNTLFEEAQQESSVLETSSRILIVHHQNEGYVGFRVHNTKKLITISIDHIHTLPVIMQKNQQIQAVWGIALVDNSPVILIDLEQL
jgi:chemotaxis signal transduction protein